MGRRLQLADVGGKSVGALTPSAVVLLRLPAESREPLSEAECRACAEWLASVVVGARQAAHQPELARTML